MDNFDITELPEVPIITVGPLAGSTVAPFAAWLGIVVLEGDHGRSLLTMPSSPRLINRRGVIHGGAIATLMDSSMAVATRTISPGLETLGTVDLNIHFMEPASGALTARSEVKRSGKSLAFCQCEVHDESGLLVATAMSSFKLRPRRPE